MIHTEEDAVFVRYWADRFELDAQAVDKATILRILPARIRRAYVEATFQVTTELREQILSYERRRAR